MIYIIIPTLNEAENLEPLVKKINSVSPSYRIIFIDDNSKDGTQEILKKLSKKYNVSFFIRKKKKGYGSALKLGFKKLNAKATDIIITMDADLSHNPKDIPFMVKKILQGYDVVIGSRYIKGGKIKRWPTSRKIISKLANLFIKLALGTGVKDNTSGFRAYSGNFINKIKGQIRSEGYSILEEILFLAIKENAKICEHPITFFDRKKGKSKARIIKEATNLLNMTLRLRKEEIKKFFKFCVVGVSGIIVNEGLLWLLTEFADLFYLISSIIAIETSILTNFVLNDLWTFKDKKKGNYFLRMLKFNAARIFTGFINWIVLFILTNLGIHYLISNLIGIAVATLIGYIISLKWVWK